MKYHTLHTITVYDALPVSWPYMGTFFHSASRFPDFPITVESSLVSLYSYSRETPLPSEYRDQFCSLLPMALIE